MMSLMIVVTELLSLLFQAATVDKTQDELTLLPEGLSKFLYKIVVKSK